MAAPLHDRLLSLMDAGTVSWIVASDEPAARFVALTRLLGVSESDVRAASERAASLASAGVRDLVETLPAWGTDSYERRDSVRFLPNALLVLHALGVRSGDFPVVDAAVESVLSHQDRDGRFGSPTQLGTRDTPAAAVLCDSHTIVEVALRFGRRHDQRVERALERMLIDVQRSPHGKAWCCEPHRRLVPLPALGRARELCPYATVTALRAFALLPEHERPSVATEAARALLAVWQHRAKERPSGFGHGYQFATIRWPHLWYDALAVIEAVAPYASAWADRESVPSGRSSLAEIAAVLVASNTDEAGRIVPQRAAPGFRAFSFGRTGAPSPLATAFVRSALEPLRSLVDEIAAVDIAPVTAPPPPPTATGRREQRFQCNVLLTPRSATTEAVVARHLQRHHIGTPWILASPETLVADLVALPVLEPRAPYIAVAARLGPDAPPQLERALYERRSLVTFRCMRGGLFVVRTDMLPVIAAATGRAVRHHSARFLGSRGVTGRHYEMIAERVLDALADAPLTIAELRERTRPHADLAAIVTHMCNEGLVVRDRPADGPFGHRVRYARTDRALPGLRLDSMTEERATWELVRTYVRAYGPVTAADIAWWTGVGPRRTAQTLADLADELTKVALTELDGPAFMHLADVDELESATIAGRPVVALLPAGDALLSCRTQRGLHVTGPLRPYVFDRIGRPAPVLLVDGVVQGVWDLDPSGVRLCALTALSAETRSRFDGVGLALAGALGAPPRVAWVTGARPLHEALLHALVHPLWTAGAAQG